ncbi:hypothetical protein Scep_009704 [Stephania cephalantha]|uniref:Chlorophyllase n=1 Tax=Stephania cephalantha TaxID=152367 RepID=A0AAP0JTN2_9MAGN
MSVPSLHLATFRYLTAVDYVDSVLFDVAGPDSTEEIKAAASVTEWLANGLQPELPTLVQPNLTKLGIAGHSRGGKVAFALAVDQHKMISHTSLKYSALMGIDPVDGMGKGSQTPPPVLTYVPHSFDVNMAAMVVGPGLGELRKNPLFPPCAPNGVNHRDFFDECCSPACHFVVKDYGHLDMLDDETRGLRGRATYCICKNGKAREPMRRFVGGVIVAFMKAYLEDKHEELLDIRQMREGNATGLPVELKLWTAEFD